jgi:signal transduction histidine kinase
MVVIVGDFLDDHAIKTGKMRLEVEAIDLNQIVEQVAGQFLPIVEQKQIAFTTDLDRSLGAIQADPNRMVQVISNLIGNALKFTRSGGKVVVRTRAGEGAQRFEVEDTGPGIPAEEMPFLFQEFARLANRPTGGERSTGLGLSISRQLVELHGGQIGAESKVGQGSLFWFELPA